MKNFKEKLASFRILKLLNIYFNYSHTPTSFAYSLSMFFWVSIVACFCTIRFHPITEIFNYLLFPMSLLFNLNVLTVLLYAAASVHRNSSSFVNSMKNREILGLEKNSINKKQIIKEVRRQMVGLRAFGVRCGPVIFVTKSSLLTVYGVYSNYSASLLIALPDTFFQN